MNKNEKPSEKKSAVDPTDPRQAAFMAGGLTGAVAGATLGSAAGPIGTVAGAAVGGFAGAKTAERIQIDLAAEDHYWESNWKNRPYSSTVSSYSEIQPAYRAGYDLPEDVYLDDNTTFETAEPTLRKTYERNSGSGLKWDSARPAAKDAFDRVIQNRRLNSRTERH
ncbi:MAG: hypothetical protein U0136_20255 [Bdellovibrionota bacterium]